ncbi:MAG TPA: L,D-transpeptidase [Ramlibacter sp.]|uniref:L,D-transpeptidase n=1 Tax=Ramlibacter sp. TaxID=1917967 RepID=UPI002CF3CECA|nr:L,D-transpeptidase [Ramlibacter sp.]HVZ46203.1 L,D-transpeptidase [Ramlibacter sp.]
MQYKALGLRAALAAAIFSAGTLLSWPTHAGGPPPLKVPGAEVRQLLGWVHATHDHHGRPFAVVDKKQAMLYVFHGDGSLAGASSALLGATPGDFTVPGVGERAQLGQVREDERTTPAGRFDSEPGRNAAGEPIVWVDYENAFAIHRLRPGRSEAARQARLESPRAQDHRVSLGCVIVPVAFYKSVVERVLGTTKSVVYVLPETRALAEVFGGA